MTTDHSAVAATTARLLELPAPELADGADKASTLGGALVLVGYDEIKAMLA